MRKAAAFIVLLLVPLFFSVAYAADQVTIPYNKFNTWTLTWYTLNQSYSFWIADVTVNLNFTGYDNIATVRFASSSSSPFISLHFNGEGTVMVFISHTGGEPSQLASGAYSKNKPVRVELTSDGYLTVKSGNLAIVDRYAFQRLDVAIIGAQGGARATGGSVTVTIKENVMGAAIHTVYDILPVILSIAMLGIALKYLKGKSV